MKFLSELDDDRFARVVIAQDLKEFGIKVPKIKKSSKSQDKNHSPGVGVFGRRLTNLPTVPVSTPAGSYQVPTFLVTTVNFLEEHIETEGIFRKSGSHARQKDLKIKVDEGGEYGEASVLDVANLFKQFFRELPDPLFTHRLHSCLLKAQELQQDRDRIMALLSVCAMLPTLHLNTLQYTMAFLARLAARADANKMDENNLALIMTPNLMPTPEKTAMDISSEKLLKMQTEVVKFLIQNSHSIGAVPDSVLERAAQMSGKDMDGLVSGDELDKSVDSLLDGSKTKRKKRRSGSIQGIVNGISQGLNKLRHGSSSSIKTPSRQNSSSDQADSEVITNIPAVMMSEVTPRIMRSTKRKAEDDHAAFSAAKRKAILQQMGQRQAKPQYGAAGRTPEGLLTPSNLIQADLDADSITSRLDRDSYRQYATLCYGLDRSLQQAETPLTHAHKKMCISSDQLFTPGSPTSPSIQFVEPPGQSVSFKAGSLQDSIVSTASQSKATPSKNIGKILADKLKRRSSGGSKLRRSLKKRFSGGRGKSEKSPLVQSASLNLENVGSRLANHPPDTGLSTIDFGASPKLNEKVRGSFFKMHARAGPSKSLPVPNAERPTSPLLNFSRRSNTMDPNSSTLTTSSTVTSSTEGAKTPDVSMISTSFLNDTSRTPDVSVITTGSRDSKTPEEPNSENMMMMVDADLAKTPEEPKKGNPLLMAADLVKTPYKSHLAGAGEQVFAAGVDVVKTPFKEHLTARCEPADSPKVVTVDIHMRSSPMGKRPLLDAGDQSTSAPAQVQADALTQSAVRNLGFEVDVETATPPERHNSPADVPELPSLVAYTRTTKFFPSLGIPEPPSSTHGEKESLCSPDLGIDSPSSPAKRPLAQQDEVISSPSKRARMGQQGSQYHLSLNVAGKNITMTLQERVRARASITSETKESHEVGSTESAVSRESTSAEEKPQITIEKDVQGAEDAPKEEAVQTTVTQPSTTSQQQSSRANSVKRVQPSPTKKANSASQNAAAKRRNDATPTKKAVTPKKTRTPSGRTPGRGTPGSTGKTTTTSSVVRKGSSVVQRKASDRKAAVRSNSGKERERAPVVRRNSDKDKKAPIVAKTSFRNMGDHTAARARRDALVRKESEKKKSEATVARKDSKERSASRPGRVGSLGKADKPPTRAGRPLPSFRTNASPAKKTDKTSSKAEVNGLGKRRPVISSPLKNSSDMHKKVEKNLKVLIDLEQTLSCLSPSGNSKSSTGSTSSVDSDGQSDGTEKKEMKPRDSTTSMYVYSPGKGSGIPITRAQKTSPPSTEPLKTPTKYVSDSALPSASLPADTSSPSQVQHAASFPSIPREIRTGTVASSIEVWNNMSMDADNRFTSPLRAVKNPLLFRKSPARRSWHMGDTPSKKEPETQDKPDPNNSTTSVSTSKLSSAATPKLPTTPLVKALSIDSSMANVGLEFKPEDMDTSCQSSRSVAAALDALQAENINLNDSYNIANSHAVQSPARKVAVSPLKPVNTPKTLPPLKMALDKTPRIKQALLLPGQDENGSTPLHTKLGAAIKTPKRATNLKRSTPVKVRRFHSPHKATYKPKSATKSPRKYPASPKAPDLSGDITPAPTKQDWMI
ncbi:serine-rich adhesin for platelets-like isoform X2 [Branchiostoma lanceolatum]|uniref:serine-rich adhesin for platelets-like isoform X2 n=1 Tax=Branchiostoma lanceolatum TaxID=7740 RepID=UPI0034528286